MLGLFELCKSSSGRKELVYVAGGCRRAVTLQTHEDPSAIEGYVVFTHTNVTFTLRVDEMSQERTVAYSLRCHGQLKMDTISQK